MQLEIRVVGKVQNVWFRASTAAVATDLGLRGFAKNLADGSVEVVAVGEKKDLEKLGKWCERGSAGASVERVGKKWSEDEEDFTDFSIL